MAAGLGFKTFITGEVLTAGDVNGYLMQGINVFASEAARNAAITSPQEGQFAYTKDNNSLWYYTGSAWAASGATGDIEGVTVTSPLTGGGTSGTVTVGILSGTTSNLGAVQLSDSTSSTSTTLAATANAVKTSYDLAAAAIPKSTVTTSGDVLYATGSSAVTRLGIGSTGQVLTVAAGVPSWATPAAGGGGKVLQVVSTTKTDTFTSTSTSFTDITGLSVSITPSATTSKIMVFYNVTGSGDVGVNTSSIRLVRGSTAINIGDAAGSRTPATNGIFEGETTAIGNASTNFLDAPATTSATTYKIQVRCNNGGNSFINRSESDSDQGQNNRTTSTITVMEIGA
jgi:hypothetical protein